jgi:hypothetical protein
VNVNRSNADDTLPMTSAHAQAAEVWDNERALAHEKAHCRLWPADHPGARYECLIADAAP